MRRLRKRQATSRTGGMNSNRPMMSVTKPGISSSTAASMIMAPCASSRPGSRPASSSVRMRLIAPNPWMRSSSDAGDRRQHHQADRPQHADLAADTDETGDLDERQRQDEERK